MENLGVIAIVGASLAGTHAAAALREYGFDGKLVILGEEPYAPYERPPLSKQFLSGEQTHVSPVLSDERLAQLDATWHLGTRVAGLDLTAKRLKIRGDDQVAFDGLVIATGAVARRMKLCSVDGVYVLRGLDDAARLRTRLDESASRVIIVGGGFLGAEIAATCRSRGLDVTIIEAMVQPMASAVGIEVGAALAQLHREHGVDVRAGVWVTGYTADSGNRLQALHLSDGSAVAGEVAIVAIGIVPATDWLEGFPVSRSTMVSYVMGEGWHTHE